MNHRLPIFGRIPEKQRSQYVKHIDAFIKAQNGRKIKALSDAEVNAYRGRPGRRNRPDGRQFARRSHAIRMATSVCQDVDWQHWLNSAGELDIEHPLRRKSQRRARVETAIGIALGGSAARRQSNVTPCGWLATLRARCCRSRSRAEPAPTTGRGLAESREHPLLDQRQNSLHQ